MTDSEQRTQYLFAHRPARVRMIGLDLDGTTLNKENMLNPRVRHAIQRALAAGIVVLPATGRPLANVTPQILDIPGIRYIVSQNGAVVVDRHENAAICRDCFRPKDALVLYDICLKHNIITSVSLDGHGYFVNLDIPAISHLFPAEALRRFPQRTMEPGALRARIAAEEVEKFALVFPDTELREKAKVWFAETGLCALSASFGFNLELNTPTANKGAALVWLGKRLGIAKEEIMALGDGTNDLTMLQSVGYGVAMGNAHPLLLDAAKDVTATNVEDGVALAIEAVLA